MELTSFNAVQTQIISLENEILKLKKQVFPSYNYYTKSELYTKSEIDDIVELNVSQIAYCSGGMSFTTSPVDVSGCSLTLTKAGIYLIFAAAEILISGTDRSVLLSCHVGLNFDSTLQTNTATMYSPGTTNITQVGGTVFQQWVVTASIGSVAKLQLFKSSGAATQSTLGTNTSISALWVGE